MSENSAHATDEVNLNAIKRQPSKLRELEQEEQHQQWQRGLEAEIKRSKKALAELEDVALAEYMQELSHQDNGSHQAQTSDQDSGPGQQSS
ncbi:hypothetical protein KCU77_g1042, partial [Aureobasidium melanogenum]